MKLKPYPEYKPSGVEWLGDVPEHWKVKRLKMAAQLTDKKVEADPDNPVPYIGMENIQSWTGRLLPLDPDVVPTGTANAFKAGHTLFGKLRPYLAKACTPDFDGLCSTELLVLNGIKFERDSLRYALLSDGFVKLVDSSTYGSKMPRASWDFIGNCILPIPPPAEQRAIADFLDRETGKIDRLVAKKRELIGKLKEQRAALITRAVTRGLNPDAKMKPSGVEWLGDVPEGWGVKKVTHGFRKIGSGTTPKSDSDEYYDGEVPWVTTSELREMLICETKQSVTKSALTDHSALRVYPENTVLFAMYGATIGRLGILGVPATVNQACCAFAWPTLFDSPFVFYWLWMRRPILVSLSSGGGQPNLSQGDLRQIRIPTPPLPEQRAIADFLDRETGKIDRLAAKVDEAIARLQEYRAALITAAVTGKIDVREAAGMGKRLEYPEPEPALRMVAEESVPEKGTYMVDDKKGTA